MCTNGYKDVILKNGATKNLWELIDLRSFAALRMMFFIAALAQRFPAVKASVQAAKEAFLSNQNTVETGRS